MNINESLENGKIAIALRTARTAMGWNQQEFAEKMGVAKSTIARIETLEMGAKANFLLSAINLFRESGIDVELGSAASIQLGIRQTAVTAAVEALQDESKRRKDRGVGLQRKNTDEPE